jgi:hypothetical protein
VWDHDKKAYKKKKFGVDGQIVNEDHKIVEKDKKRIEKMQDRYKQWRKSSVMNFQKIGDREVGDNTAKATSSFKNRMNRKQVSDAIKRKKDFTSDVISAKSNKFGKKEGFLKGRKVRDELKNFNQIAKDKAQKRLKSSGKGGKDGGRGGRSKGRGGRTGGGRTTK